MCHSVLDFVVNSIWRLSKIIVMIGAFEARVGSKEIKEENDVGTFALTTPVALKNALINPQGVPKNTKGVQF